MAEKIKNLCAPIPESLHAQLRQRQEASGQTLGAYMTWLLTTFYEQEEMTMKENQRTIAFQVPEELFKRFKAHLKERGLKQNAFFLACIRQALESTEGECAEKQDNGQ